MLADLQQEPLPPVLHGLIPAALPLRMCFEHICCRALPRRTARVVIEVVYLKFTTFRNSVPNSKKNPSYQFYFYQTSPNSTRRKKSLSYREREREYLLLLSLKYFFWESSCGFSLEESDLYSFAIERFNDSLEKYSHQCYVFRELQVKKIKDV